MNTVLAIIRLTQIPFHATVMHQSFVSTAPSGPGISGAFNFSIFKAPLKALLSGAKIVVKSLLKAPALPGADNNEEQQMT